jgi:dihydroorotate dehydrogenase (fumarate)
MDLSTRYLGLNLRTPLVPSASPICDEIDNIKRMEDAGAAAVVLHSLFEEQLTREQDVIKHHLMFGADSFPEALTYLPQPEEFHMGPDEYPITSEKRRSVHILVPASTGRRLRLIDYAKRSSRQVYGLNNITFPQR